MNQSALTPVITPVSLEKIAYDAIKEAILTFRFKPGESLVENELARQLKISKTPVRESLSRLERESFIVKIPYKGYYVAEISLQGMLDLFAIRSVLEALAIRLATPLVSEEIIERAKELIDEHASAAESNNIMLASQLNRQFHDLLVQCSNNERLLQILTNLEDHLRRYRLLSNFQTGRLQKSVNEHYEILDAVVRRDAVAAEEATRRHILSVSEDLTHQNFDELVAQITV